MIFGDDVLTVVRQATDRHGDDYEVEGDPAVWSPPVGPEHHLEVVLKRVKG